MTVETRFEVAGVADAIRQLNKIEPGLRKKFVAEVNDIAEPALSQARRAYRFVPISGLERNWSGPAVKGRKVAPLTIEKAQKGLKVKVDTGRKATSTIYIQQTDPGWAIFETAGRKTSNRLGSSLGPLESGRTRLFGRVIYSVSDEIQKKIAKHALDVVNAINANMRIK